MLKLTGKGRFSEAERDVISLMLGLGMKPRALGIALGRPARNFASYVSKGRFSADPDVNAIDLSRRHREWTEDEEILLTELARLGHGMPQVAVILGRPERVTVQKVAELDL